LNKKLRIIILAGIKFNQIIHALLSQAKLMDLVAGDKVKGLNTPIWDIYKKLMNDAEGKEV